MMRLSPLRRALGLVLVLIGGTWGLLGLGILGGSVATGQAWPVVAGAVALAAGVAVLTVRVPPDERRRPDVGE